MNKAIIRVKARVFRYDVNYQRSCLELFVHKWELISGYRAPTKQRYLEILVHKLRPYPELLLELLAELDSPTCSVSYIEERILRLP